MAHRGYTTPVTKQRIRPGQTGPRVEAALAEIAVIEGLGQMDGRDIVLEDYQRRFMLNRSRFRCVEKARQTGYSWVFAAEAVARCHLRPAHTAIFVSYNLGDAVEKVRYARMLAEALPDGFRKDTSEDAKTHVSFKDPGTGSTSRILSHPSRAPRGKGGDVYLDELAHYQNDVAVYKGTTALITRHPTAQLTICSTPAGRRGVFWEVAREETEKRYPEYFRQRVPWWLSRHYCKDPLAAVNDNIATMPTDTRIEKWGLPPIHEQRQSLLLDDFRQEFEVEYIDERHSFYPWEYLLGCAKDVNLEQGFHNWTVRGRLTAGYDVGRVRDLSALCITEEIEGHTFVRYMRTWQRAPFPEQHAVLMECLDALPIARLSIDQNGLGRMLAEQLAEQYGDRVRPENFTLQNKEIWATDLKIMLENKSITLPRDRELLTQMHSIRRVVVGGKPRFDAETNARHHGDLYWALALATQRERTHKPARIVVRARVI
jgi:phage FluMu gp28-like protein